MGWFVLLYTLHHASYPKPFKNNHIEPSSVCYAMVHLTKTQRHSATGMLHADMTSYAVKHAMNAINQPIIFYRRDCNRLEMLQIVRDAVRHWVKMQSKTAMTSYLCLQICRTISVILFLCSAIFHRIIPALNFYHIRTQ
jgi:hypothetical protein